MTAAGTPARPGNVQPIWFKLGHIVPHLRLDLNPYQFYRVAPQGVMLVTVPFDLADYSHSAVRQQLAGLWDRVDSLMERDADRVVLAGVPVAASLGRPQTLQLIDRVAAKSGRPADSDLEAHAKAIHHLGADKIAMATRWDQRVNEAVKRYLSDAGITVVSTAAHARDLSQNKSSDPNADHDLMVRLGRQAVLTAEGAVEALLMPGGLGLVVDAAAILEQELGIPVLINAVSTVWAALNDFGAEIPVPLPGDAGRLMQTLSGRPAGSGD
jgi:maleate cis-trans isomerase